MAWQADIAANFPKEFKRQGAMTFASFLLRYDFETKVSPASTMLQQHACSHPLPASHTLAPPACPTLPPVADPPSSASASLLPCCSLVPPCPPCSCSLPHGYLPSRCVASRQASERTSEREAGR